MREKKRKNIKIKILIRIVGEKKSHHHEEQKHTQQKYTILLNQFAQTIQPKLHPKKNKSNKEKL